MNKQEKAIAKEKKLEFWLGIFFLIPPILGVIAFILCLFDIGSDYDYTDLFNKGCGGVGMSAAPIYLGIMAIVGAYLIKSNARYIFINENTESPQKDKENI